MCYVIKNHIMYKKCESGIGIGVMKKIIKTLVMLSILTLALPSFGCGEDKLYGITGGACSISELRNIEKNRIATDKDGLNPKRVIDLRPVRLTPEKSKFQEDECLFGSCLYKTLLGK